MVQRNRLALLCYPEGRKVVCHPLARRRCSVRVGFSLFPHPCAFGLESVQAEDWMANPLHLGAVALDRVAEVSRGLPFHSQRSSA